MDLVAYALVVGLILVAGLLALAKSIRERKRKERIRDLNYFKSLDGK